MLRSGGVCAGQLCDNTGWTCHWLWQQPHQRDTKCNTLLLSITFFYSFQNPPAPELIRNWHFVQVWDVFKLWTKNNDCRTAIYRQFFFSVVYYSLASSSIDYHQ